MVKIDINVYLNTHYNKSTATKIGSTHKTSPTDILFGKLELKDWPELKDIELNRNELEEAVIIDCPKLEKINVGENKLTKLDIKKVKTNADSSPAPAEKLNQLCESEKMQI